MKQIEIQIFINYQTAMNNIYAEWERIMRGSCEK